MTEIQKQFEEWAATDEGLSLKLSFPLLADNSVSSAVYASAQTRVAWQAWQASRAAIVVKLPETHNGWLDKQVVQYAIEAEGLKHE